MEYVIAMRDFIILVLGCLALAACSTTIPNNAAVTSPEALDREAWNSCRDIMIVLPADRPASCPNRMHFAPGEVARSPDGTKVGYFCICEGFKGN